MRSEEEIKERIESLKKLINELGGSPGFSAQIGTLNWVLDEVEADIENRQSVKTFSKEEIFKKIDEIDTEKYIGPYCFEAKSFKKDLKEKFRNQDKGAKQ